MGRPAPNLDEQIRRNTADGILETVDRKGKITMPSLLRLLDLLKKKTSYEHHIEVAVVTGALVKTLDNETDVLETIRRLEAVPDKP